MSIWRAPTASGLVRLGLKSLVAGLPDMSWPPVVMKRVYQSDRREGEVVGADEADAGDVVRS